MTAKPQRIQLARRKGWRLPDNTVVVARPSPWGNPFVVGVDGDRASCVELYRILMLGGYARMRSVVDFAAQQAAFIYVTSNIHLLRGKDLACWCALDGKPCHADVLLDLANQ